MFLKIFLNQHIRMNYERSCVTKAYKRLSKTFLFIYLFILYITNPNV